jgi:hypothetical protein
MASILAAWAVFLFTSFLVTVLAMTYIQFRGIARYGRRGLRKRPFFDTYWRGLSLFERVLLWPGLAAFAVTFVGVAVWKAVASLS